MNITAEHAVSGEQGKPDGTVFATYIDGYGTVVPRVRAHFGRHSVMSRGARTVSQRKRNARLDRYAVPTAKVVGAAGSSGRRRRTERRGWAKQTGDRLSHQNRARRRTELAISGVLIFEQQCRVSVPIATQRYVADRYRARYYGVLGHSAQIFVEVRNAPYIMPRCSRHIAAPLARRIAVEHRLHLVYLTLLPAYFVPPVLVACVLLRQQTSCAAAATNRLPVERQV